MSGTIQWDERGPVTFQDVWVAGDWCPARTAAGAAVLVREGTGPEQRLSSAEQCQDCQPD